MSIPSQVRKTVRCAVYTRKSTEEGLQQEFNSLDAQREAGQAYVASQQHEGWVCRPERYDDGGCSGGNMDRPALQRLFTDIAAGRIDCVVVYKVDRLSRSLLDFARMMETFEMHGIAFVSVTQQFNTATSMGRLILNVLLSFAQFEGDIISERTRDKIAAARRKGKWSGGTPILGYDVAARTTKLIVNEAEATQVRAIFELYLRYEALPLLAQELARRGWVNKRWLTRKGQVRGGGPFTKTSLHKLLTNVAYVGQVKHKDAVHQGEQPALVEEGLWHQVQEALRRHGHTKGALARNRCGALLKGLLYCVPCGCRMTPTHATNNGGKRYRYYVCTSGLKGGVCTGKFIAAQGLEQVVLDQLKGLEDSQASCLTDWDALPPPQQARLVRLLVERVAYDATAGKLTIAFHDNGLMRLKAEQETNHDDSSKR
jgi:site-specific DNA recombinase